MAVYLLRCSSRLGIYYGGLSVPRMEVYLIPPVVLVRESSLNAQIMKRRPLTELLWIVLPGLLILAMSQMTRHESDSSALYPLLSLAEGLLLVLGFFLGIALWMTTVSRLLEPVVKALMTSLAAISARNLRSERTQNTAESAPSAFFNNRKGWVSVRASSEPMSLLPVTLQQPPAHVTAHAVHAATYAAGRQSLTARRTLSCYRNLAKITSVTGNESSKIMAV